LHVGAGRGCVLAYRRNHVALAQRQAHRVDSGCTARSALTLVLPLQCLIAVHFRCRYMRDRSSIGSEAFGAAAAAVTMCVGCL